MLCTLGTFTSRRIRTHLGSLEIGVVGFTLHKKVGLVSTSTPGGFSV
jgi:hypothetical protein